MSPRFGPLCRVSSLERLFKGYADLQTPRGWANHRHIGWLWPTESFITWSAPSYCHKANIETRSPTLRHSLWTQFWRADGFMWGIWWWCIWYPAVGARPKYFPTAASLLEYSRMSGLIWAEKRTSRPLLVMIHTMSSPWDGWSSRRPPIALGLGELSDL